MNLDAVPIWLLFAGTVFFVMLSVELGRRLSHRARRTSRDEKPSSASAIAGSASGLVAFMLAFTFGIVTNRFDTRKSLVREEANIIGTAYLRTDFLPEPERAEAKTLLKDYLADRIDAAATIRSGEMSPEELEASLEKANRTHTRLWAMAVENARRDTNSHVAALYIESLNDLIDIHSVRVAIAVQARVPMGIWTALLAITFLGMVALGYSMGIAASTRPLVEPALALSFSVVISLIAVLDRPHTSYIRVSQQPFIDLLQSM